MMETEFREESFAIAQTLKAHAEKNGRTLDAVRAGVGVGATTIVTLGDRRPAHARAVERLRRRDRHAVDDEDEALVDSLVTPGHPSTPGYNDPQYPFYGRIVD